MNKFFTQWMKTINLEIQKQLSSPNHTIMRKLKPKNILNKKPKKVMNNRKCLKQTGKKTTNTGEQKQISCFSLKNTIEKKDIAKFSLNLYKNNLSSLNFIEMQKTFQKWSKYIFRQVGLDYLLPTIL